MRESFDDISRCLRSTDIISLSLALVLSPPPPSTSFSLPLFARATILVRFASSFSYTFCTPGRSLSIPFSSPTHERLPLLLPIRYIPLARSPSLPSSSRSLLSRQPGSAHTHTHTWKNRFGRSVSRGFSFDIFEREKRARFARRAESHRGFPKIGFRKSVDEI